MVSGHAEQTFERLRYSFGGDRPSQTARLTMSPDQIHGHRLEFQHFKGGIPRATPHKLTPVLLRGCFYGAGIMPVTRDKTERPHGALL